MLCSQGCNWARGKGMLEDSSGCMRMYRGASRAVEFDGLYSFAGLEFG